jgi:hypothetical protein
MRRGAALGWLFAIALVVSGASKARASETFVATLSPRAGTGSTGSGSATLVLDDLETQLSYTITFSGLTSTEVAAHIHGPDGAALYTLPNGSPKVGVWTTIGFVDVVNLRAGKLFILIHTVDNPAGELRGDVTAQQVGVETGTWGKIKALYR